MKLLKYIAGFFFTAVLFSCDKQLDELTPHNVYFEDQQFITREGYTRATLGNYAFLTGSGATNTYHSDWFNISEYRGNNVRFIDLTSTNSLTASKDVDAFNFINSESKDFGLSRNFWFGSYQALLGVNMVLQNVKEGETDPVILQAKAENLFLRAMLYFNLVRVYGRPYYQNPETNLGVPLILAPITSVGNAPERATVKATYEQIIKDLNDAIPSFRISKTNSYASKYAAFALLSRVYLYMSGPFTQPNTGFAQQSKQYADSVILYGGYQLLQATAYQNYFNNNNLANKETIWAINFDAFSNTLPTLLLQQTGTYTGNSSYRVGQAKPSPDLLGLISNTDLRRSHYKTDHPYVGNTTDPISSAKYTYQYTQVYTSRAPIHYLRLAEVYLNRAEASVKAGDNATALQDLNTIRNRAGLTSLSGITGQALFNEILLERRRELAFEGHISYDYFRNGLPMVRNYTSFDSPAMTINATDPKVVMRISQDVLAENGKIKQNIQ